MDWEQACKCSKLGKRFHNVDVCSLPDGLKRIGNKWTKNMTSMVLHGKTGRGKTYFSACLYKWTVEKKMRNIQFRKAKHIDDLILENITTFGSSKSIIRTLSELDVLFIDDFGIDRPTERAERDLYDILDARWSNELVTVISTNLDSEQIENNYGSRILSRLKDCEWVEFGGEDRRGF